jgi:Holliday junction resolvase RusA-like endonuclease
MITITLPYPPTSNHRLLRGNRGKLVLSSEARSYKNTVRLLCAAKRLRPLLGDVVLKINFFRPRRIGDVSNRIKTLEDALSGFAFEDDSQVAELHVARFEDKDNPRAEVSVWLQSDEPKP